MKILMIPSNPIKSGTGLRLLGIANGLRKLGYEVEIAETRKQKFFSDADIVFASKTLLGSCVPVMFRKLFRKEFSILDIDDLEWGYWKNSVLKYFMFLTDRIFPRFFDIITTHTHALKKYINKELKIREEKIIFLPQGIEFSIFKNIKWRPSRNKKIVYAAHLGVAALDIDVILKVFRNVLAKEKNVTLKIIGDGPFLKHYKDMAKKMGISYAVEFMGYRKHEDMPNILSECNVAVNYLRDNIANQYRSSIKVREYLAVGIPTVCNIIGDISLFRKYIYSFPSEELWLFEEQIIKALNSPDRKKLDDGRELVRRDHDWNIIIKKFEGKLNLYMLRQQKHYKVLL